MTFNIGRTLVILALILLSSVTIFIAAIEWPQKLQVVKAASLPILDSHFDTSAEDFLYADDTFKNTLSEAYATGTWNETGGHQGGGLSVTLGGIDATTTLAMSGGWKKTFTTPTSNSFSLTFEHNLSQNNLDSDEKLYLYVSIDGTLYGTIPAREYMTYLRGNSATSTLGWHKAQLVIGPIPAGTHTLTIGGFLTKKTDSTETGTIAIDNVSIITASQWIVNRTGQSRFTNTIKTLSSFGDRTQGSASYATSSAWLESKLMAAGYTVEHFPYTYKGESRDQIYVTKVGSVHPDEMYIVSAHLDGRGGGGAADDDASGSALVLEGALAFAPTNIRTDRSIRFIWWNNEETGSNGSRAYVSARRPLQGIENPAGSGIYPEPRWLGMIQHDMILYDHGMPPTAKQNPAADIDIEYQASTTLATQSKNLADLFFAGNQIYRTKYPVEVSNKMAYTDSDSFKNYVPSISIRENRRLLEIGAGSNPHYHQATDIASSYSSSDFQFGYDVVKTVVGTIAEIAGVVR